MAPWSLKVLVTPVVDDWAANYIVGVEFGFLLQVNLEDFQYITKQGNDLSSSSTQFLIN